MIRGGGEIISDGHHCRIHCAGGHCCPRTYRGCRLVDIGNTDLRDDSQSDGTILFVWLTEFKLQYATTPFKGAERNDTFANIRMLPAHFRDNPKVSRWVIAHKSYYYCADLFRIAVLGKIASLGYWTRTKRLG